MSLGSSKLTSLIAIALVSPMVVLFQNCGSNSGYGQTKDTKTAREAHAASQGGYSAAGGGSGGYGSSGGSSGGGGTFTFPGGGSSGGGSTGGGSNGGSSGGYPPGFVPPDIKSDGSNCYEGEFAIDKQAYNVFGGGDLAIKLLRGIPFSEIRNVDNPATKLSFPDAIHGDVEGFNCQVSFDKMKKMFPQEWFNSARYTCTGNQNNSTYLQCRSGQWFFASSTCECRYIPPVNQPGGNN